MKSLLLALVAALCAASGPDQGFGSQYKWSSSLAAAHAEAKEQNKPLMVLISKSWCGACKALKPKVAESQEMLAAQQETGIVMVSLADDDEPKGEQYAPGGAGYIPRIMFYAPDGRLMPQLNSGNDKYLYYYFDPVAIAANMRRAAEVVADHDRNLKSGSSAGEEL